jgi:hypothetical protein
MARLKTKGPPIAFRLPLPLDAALYQRCQSLGVPVHAWVAALVARELRRGEANRGKA